MNVAAAGLTDLKFRLTREDFSDAVAWVARNLPSRPTVPVLAGVLLTGSDDGLTVSGFDYEVSAEVKIPAEIASWKCFGFWPAALRYCQGIAG